MLEEYDLSSIALKIEEQNKYLKKELSESKKLLQTQNETITRLKGVIKYEKMKNSIYTNIITSLTDVKLDDIIEEIRKIKISDILDEYIETKKFDEFLCYFIFFTLSKL